VSGRVAINSTAYGNCSCGHAWFTLDGKIVANFCTLAAYNRQVYEYETGCLPSHLHNRYKQQSVEYGELSRQDIYQACWDYVHCLSFDEAIACADFEIQVLAVLDKRLGKRRIMKMRGENLHPLVRTFLGLRMGKGGF
jgi:hypothetical protein